MGSPEQNQSEPGEPRIELDAECSTGDCQNEPHHIIKVEEEVPGHPVFGHYCDDCAWMILTPATPKEEKPQEPDVYGGPASCDKCDEPIIAGSACHNCEKENGASPEASEVANTTEDARVAVTATVKCDGCGYATEQISPGANIINERCCKCFAGFMRPIGTIFELDLFRERLEWFAATFGTDEEKRSEYVGKHLQDLAAELKTLIDNCREQYVPALAADPVQEGRAVDAAFRDGWNQAVDYVNAGDDAKLEEPNASE